VQPFDGGVTFDEKPEPDSLDASSDQVAPRDEHEAQNYDTFTGVGVRVA
jgi:hypothetical protein